MSGQARRERRRVRDGSGDVTGAVMLIGLGLLFFTGWWWPGIMWVVAAAMAIRGLSTKDLNLRRRNLSGAAIVALIPLFVWTWSWRWFPWGITWPLFLIVAGGTMLMRTLGPRVPGGWREWVDEAPPVRTTEAPPVRRARPEADDEATAFDRLSTIYDPDRDKPRAASPEQPAPSLPTTDDHIQVDLGAIFADNDRRLDRARRGER